MIKEEVDFCVREPSIAQVMPQLLVGDEAIISSCQLDGILHIHSPRRENPSLSLQSSCSGSSLFHAPVVYTEKALDIVSTRLEEITHLKVWSACLQVSLHVAVGVVDNGQKHVLLWG